DGGIMLSPGELALPKPGFGRTAAAASHTGSSADAASLALSELSFAHLGIQEVDDEDDSGSSSGNSGGRGSSRSSSSDGGSNRGGGGGGVGASGQREEDEARKIEEGAGYADLDDAALLAKVPPALLGKGGIRSVVAASARPLSAKTDRRSPDKNTARDKTAAGISSLSPAPPSPKPHQRKTAAGGVVVLVKVGPPSAAGTEPTAATASAGGANSDGGGGVGAEGLGGNAGLNVTMRRR
ncbi:hypothetical protein Vretifemale_19626, partial [Volvox reticuliferus]